MQYKNGTSVGMVGKAQGKSTQKKLSIKPLKVKKLPDSFCDSSWNKLQEAIHAVQNKRAVNCSLEELYRTVEDLCYHKLAGTVYLKLEEEFDRHIQISSQKLSSHSSQDNIVFLKHVSDWWMDHKESMILIRSIFLYMDRTYVNNKNDLGVRSLFDLGLHLFCKHLRQHPQVENKTVQGILQLIQKERNGEQVPQALLRSLVKMFTNLGIYDSALEVHMLESARTFYRGEGDSLVNSMNVSDFLRHVENRLKQESMRCEQYLEETTKRKLIAVVEQELLAKHMDHLLEKGFAQMMTDVRLQDLTLLYNLCRRIDFLDRLRASFKLYVKESGESIVQDTERDKEMVDRLLQFKQRIDRIFEESFQKDENFGSSLREAFETFINQRENKPAELIAKFIDSKLRGGSKGQTDEELETSLDSALILFRYIQGKDVFEAFYKRDLSKRLLMGKSSSIDAEKSMIGKLKTECGAQFTNKLEGMFKDIDLSKDIMKSFKNIEAQSAENKLQKGIDLNVNILTSGFWPTYPVTEANLPIELNQYQERFKQFYLSKHTGRKLTWYSSLGTCVLKAYFKQGTKELQVSLFQAIVLCLFNEAEQLSYVQIQNATGIEEKELKRTLQSLACGKLRILKKQPRGPEVDDKDEFHYNADFTHNYIRINIKSIQMKETEEENKKTNEQVLQDRQYQIDAAIVRIMKTRKSLSHQLLIYELRQQLRFQVRTEDLKKRVESLIEREYLERDANDKSIYNYLA
eukprot:TRINITY_DN25752_c0_g1_i2.p1 TRINITY_DN25752_c0_g1~~TRINITY_DN25752_c0_g1_i2.p1  ORF type:complete len:745 (-),score=82.84 TRINITY_DN25752_c0_g1_i2:248-2482(-)